MSSDLHSAASPFAHFSANTSGAHFLRVDLHIHSFGVSHDVADSKMTVHGIIATALERQIGLVAITDHNAIGAVDELLAEAPKNGLAAVAGVELTLADGHALVYFDPADLSAFKKWFARLDFQEGKDANDRWLLQSLADLAADVAGAGGIMIPAHVGRTGTGCLIKATRKAQDAIIASANIAAIEVDGPAEFDWFSPDDRSAGYQQRREQSAARENSLGEVVGLRLPKVYFSDAHQLDQIGRNRDGKERLTRVKMTTPSFAAFSLALRDPHARIRIEERLPESYARLVGARFIGGFLDGQEISLSDNLTCLIGGRGAGKSTALEAIRCACLNKPHEREVADDPEWPSVIQLIYQDQFGERHYIQRTASEDTFALTEEGAIEYTVPIEGYAQDRVAEIIRSYADGDTSLLGEFLDSFANLPPCERRVAELRGRLAENADAIEPIEDATSRRKAAETALAEIQLKLKAIEKSKLKEALEFRRRLAQERELRRAVVNRLDEIQSGMASQQVAVDVRVLAQDVEAGDLATTPSKKYLIGDSKSPGLIDLVDKLRADLEKWKKSGETKLATARPAVDSVITGWQAYDQRVEARFQEIIADLRKQGINPDVKQLTKLTDNETKEKEAIRKAKADEITMAKLKRQRRGLLSDYRAAQDARFHERQQATKVLTDTLNRSIHEFKVKLGFERGSSYAEYERWLRDVVGKRLFRSERVDSFCRQVHPIELAELVGKNSKAKLLALKDDRGHGFFDGGVDDFIKCLREAGLMALETINVSDAPTISLTTAVDGKPRTVAFGRLSFGQKASVLLGALLCSDDTTPLIVDQPEDHLDSAFIFETIVTTLRNIKERRQVILATHNPNIAVLGDAELIVPMQGFGNVGRIRDSGAVDADATRKRACKILEGGAAAYERRGEMYGLR
jgi:predicted ATP-dependent endonuclease of OLD family